jgi:hypothetical protein
MTPTAGEEIRLVDGKPARAGWDFPGRVFMGSP